VKQSEEAKKIQAIPANRDRRKTSQKPTFVGKDTAIYEFTGVSEIKYALLEILP